MNKGLDSKSLKDFFKIKNEKDYKLIDVRQLNEYSLDHIPGATHIPLSQIQSGEFKIEDNRELIFYCRSGARSKVAAILVGESGYDEKKIYNLDGGMMGYTGEILLERPKLDVFSQDSSLEEQMKNAINLEKGAFLFYGLVMEKFKGTMLFDIAEKMLHAEIAHAKALFNRLKKLDTSVNKFQHFFDDCKGDILEGGKTFDEILVFLEDISPEDCIDMLDFAIELELSAYDLYKTMAENSKDDSLKEVFFTLSQAEKKHLEILIESLDLCGGES